MRPRKQFICRKTVDSLVIYIVALLSGQALINLTFIMWVDMFNRKGFRIMFSMPRDTAS